MRFMVFLMFLGFMVNTYAQKRIKKTIAGSEIASIIIDLSNCYSLTLNTFSSDAIVAQASVEGADNDDVVLKIEEKGTNIVISAGFQPNYSKRGGKFGALTFVAIDLKISLPEYLLVNLFGTSTQVKVEGRYEQLDITLADGDCILQGIFEKAAVKTQKGDIIVKSANGEVDAMSSYGKVFLESLPKGNSTYDLNSVEGNIYVNRTD